MEKSAVKTHKKKKKRISVTLGESFSLEIFMGYVEFIDLKSTGTRN